MSENGDLAEAIRDVLTSDDGSLENAADALKAVASAIKFGFKWLGNGDASTPMGAIEAHGVAMIEAAGKIETGLVEVALSLDNIASAIREKN